MEWLWIILMGLIVGAVAKFLHRGPDPGGWIVTILIGIAGSILGGYIARATQIGENGGFMGFVMAVIGAIILLAIYRFATKKR